MNTFTSRTNDSLATARTYLRRGWQVTPVRPRTKVAKLKGWPNLRLSDAQLDSYFSRGENVGVLLGAPSGALVDIDLDCAEAVKLAPFLLPETLTFGRLSNPMSHYLYRCADIETERFKSHIDGRSMIVEIRADGCQTVFPGSTHESGEDIEFSDGLNVEPTSVSVEELKRCVVRLAAGSLLAKHWPNEGGRQEAALCLSGCLKRSGWPTDDVRDFIHAVAVVAEDEEAERRADVAMYTEARLESGGTVYGWPSLIDIFGGDLVSQIREWLVAHDDDERAATIVITADEPRVTDDAIAALAKNGKVFQRGTALVRIVQSRSILAGDSTPTTKPTIGVIPNARLQECLFEAARWFRKKDGELRPTVPPRFVVPAVLARGEWPLLDTLAGAIDTPVIRPDGTVLCSRGYDAATGLYYCPSSEYLPVADSPTKDDAAAAIADILDVVCDFPFENRAHMSSFVAGLLTPFARFAFKGTPPLFLIDANMPGTGKTMLMEVIASVACGGGLEKTTFTQDDDEMRKRITALAMRGERIVQVDNISGVFGGQSLEAAITMRHWSDRRLGFNETVDCPLYGVWYATGNNVEINSDMSRRILYVRMETTSERPDQRSDFKHSDLLGWVRVQRTHLVKCALTILSAYIRAGQPKQNVRQWGSFEEWNRLVSHSLVWCGLPDPNLTREELRERSDVDSGDGNILVALLEKVDQDGVGISCAELLTKASDPAKRDLRNLLDELLPVGPGQAPSAQKLGKKLSKFRGRNFGGKMIQQVAKRSGVAMWAVRRVNVFSQKDFQVKE